MIRIFRKVRQNLLSEKNFKRYFLYALGEIFLVMIGILLALQVNTWNEERKLSREEQSLLSALEQDFLENKKELEGTIRIQRIMLRYSRDFISAIVNKQTGSISQDSLLNLKNNGANTWWRAELINSAYSTIINSGKSNLLTNITLKKKLDEFSAEIEQGFEDDFESKQSLLYMYGLTYQYEVDFMASGFQKKYNFIRDSVAVQRGLDELLSNKSYAGALFLKTEIEEDRLDYQNNLLKLTNEILTEITSSIKREN